MRQAIKESRFSRDEIVDRMNRAGAAEGLTGSRENLVTVAALDAWVAESKSNLIPLRLLPLFCGAVESLLPLKVLADCLGAEVIDADEAKILALAKIDLEVKRLARQKRRLSQELQERTHE